MPRARGGLEDKTPPPAYGDETGETAIATEIIDATLRDIESMAQHVHYALNLAKKVLAITPQDVVERAERSTPNCAACGDLISGKVFYSRWDEKCRRRFRRWVEAGNPADEKHRFEVMVRAGRGVSTDDKRNADLR